MLIPAVGNRRGPSGVSAIACATGGLLVGLPEETSLHEQAERIASLFCDRPLTGDDATPATALDMIGTSRYLHLAAHGTQDVDAPLFARVYLAGGALHAYQILERDLRGTELVTLSACESALPLYDFLDNLHGLAPSLPPRGRQSCRRSTVARRADGRRGLLHRAIRPPRRRQYPGERVSVRPEPDPRPPPELPRLGRLHLLRDLTHHNVPHSAAGGTTPDLPKQEEPPIGFSRARARALKLC
jgi:CHAT domain